MPKFFRNHEDTIYSLRGSEAPSALLFAEGFSEAYFLEKWLEKTERDPNQIAVVCVKGRPENLKTILRNFAEEENFHQVRGFGFFFDAERNRAVTTTRTIETLLKAQNIIPPRQSLNAGTQQFGDYRIAVYISPNNNDPGLIEDIVKLEIESSDLADCLDGFSTLVQEATNNKIHSKTLVQAFLGIRKPGLCGTHHGFNKSQLDVMHDAYRDVRVVMESVL
jgi:hypothetical protein